MIYGNNRCRQRKFLSRPNHAWKLYHPENFNKDLRRDTSYGNDGYWSMGSEVGISRTGSLLDVFLFLTSSLLLLFGSRPGTNGVGMGFHHVLMEVEFPRVPDPPKGRHWAVPISRRTFDFVWVRTWQECIMLLFFPFLFSCTVYAAQEVCAGWEG